MRYRIYAGRNERLAQYFKLMKFLDSLGFQKSPGDETEPEDTSETRMTGTIASASARKLLYDSRVKSILLLPSGFEVPAEGALKVQLELASGLPRDRQLLLAEQTRARLAELGFRENVGYDNRGHTRLLGTIPSGELDTLLKDVRGQPSGWLTPAVPVEQLPLPLRSLSPILVTEVLPEPEGVPPAREPPPAPAPLAKDQEHHQKISPDLRELAAGQEADNPRRLEIILTFSPTIDDPGWRRNLEAATSPLLIEGRLGPLVTVLAIPKDAPLLAALPIVSTIRLPRPAMPQVQRPRGTKAGNLEALHASGLVRLHALRHQGNGVHVAVIDGDFRGYEKLRGKQLPSSIRYLDLTAERNPSLLPDEFASEADAIGHGTECALAVALAAPRANLTLLRIDPASPHQLEAVARYLHGEPFRSEAYFQRQAQIIYEKERLARLREEVLVERKLVFSNFSQDQAAEERRQAYFKKQEALDAEEKGFQQLLERFLKMQRDFADLKNVQVVTSSLVWNEGYPLGGSSPLSRYFDERPFRSALWFQSGGNTRGQAWSGLFRDADGNGVMEFAPPSAALRPEHWSSELNFLAWHPYGKKEARELPAKAKMRITIQWREVHEPEFYPPPLLGGPDLYREPLAKLRLVVLRQRDPSGEKLSADDLEVVALSTELPQRLDNQRTYAVYEQAVEFLADPAGRYALRVEGRVPPGTWPPGIPTLPALQRSWELRPRIFVDVLDADSRKLGRPVFLDFPTDLGNLGLPADSHNVLTVGAADSSGQLRPYSTRGPALNLELLPKPDLLGFDGLLFGQGETNEAFGASQAASFAAGLAASSFSAGTERNYFLRALRERLGKPLQVP